MQWQGNDSHTPVSRLQARSLIISHTACLFADYRHDFNGPRLLDTSLTLTSWSKAPTHFLAQSDPLTL